MKNSSNIQLAIIVPYYKNDFFAEALQSIQLQTNQNFNLYIGDDASPNAIDGYLNELANVLKQRLIYYRFENNLGSNSLTKQWERCIKLSGNEKYIWLFSDDDIMPIDAVQRFYNFINTSSDKDVIRFNIAIINNKGKILGQTESHPDYETAESFARRRIEGKCISTACEYIFSRTIYETKNGFVEFPLAWASDDATWIKFSEDKGIVTLSGKPVLWRMSGLNISSDSAKSFEKKFISSILYIKFLDVRFNFSDEEKIEWLIGQLNLVGHLTRYKREFKKQLKQSNLFTESFIRNYLLKRKIEGFFIRIKRKIKAFSKM